MNINTSIILTSLSLFISLYIHAQWTGIRNDGITNFHHIQAITNETVFTIGINNISNNVMLIKSLDGGTTWDSSLINDPMDYLNIYGFHFVDSQIGYVSGIKNFGGIIYKTNNAGATWTDVTPNLTGGPFYHVHFKNQNVGLASTNNKVYKTLNGGLTWQLVQIGNYSGVSDLYCSPDVWYVCCRNTQNLSALLMSTDSGNTWNSALQETDTNLIYMDYTLDYIDNSTLITALYGSNKIYKTNDAGITWQSLIVDSISHIRRIDFQDYLKGHILSNNQIWRTEDGGLSWNKEYDAGWSLYGTSVQINDISITPETGYAAASEGLVKKWDGITNINDVKLDSQSTIQLFPNPVTSKELYIKQPVTGPFKILNSSGKIVKEDNLKTNRIQLSNLKPGFYLIVWENHPKPSKFIIK